MKALLALRSVGFCVGQRQMCLQVRWNFFLFVFMQQKFLCYSVVCLFFTMNGNVKAMFSAGCQSCALSCLSGVCYLGRSLLTGPGPALNIAAVVRMCFVPIYKGFNIFHCFPVCKNTFFNNMPIVFPCFFSPNIACPFVFFIIFCLFFTPGHTYPIGFYATLCIRKSCPIKMALLKVIACVWPLPFSLVYR